MSNSQAASLLLLNDGNRIPQVGLGTWKSLKVRRASFLFNNIIHFFLFN